MPAGEKGGTDHEEKKSTCLFIIINVFGNESDPAGNGRGYSNYY